MLRRSSISLATFGMIGLGRLGSGMAVNVLKDKNVDKLFLYDSDEDELERVLKAAIKAHGEERAKSAIQHVKTVAEIGAQSDTIVTMLPSSRKIVRDVYNKLLKSPLKKGAFLIDSSTIDAATARTLAAKAVAAGAAAFCRRRRERQMHRQR